MKQQKIQAIFQPLALRRSKMYTNIILSHLKNKKTILDIGPGDCHISVMLQQAGYKVSGLDIVNKSFSKNFKPVIYDGKKIPFPDNQFDVALMLMMLHHTPEPENIIKEASRVARRLIIIEDIYSNKFNKYITYFFDSLLNMEFRGHPHSNKTDAEWQKLFNSMGFQVVSKSYARAYLVFAHAIYILE